MKERPILLMAEMVRATLDNKKTKTRRTRGLEDVNKNPDVWTFVKLGNLSYMANKSTQGKFGAYFESNSIAPNTLYVCPQVCPYGRPGDRLWVRETWGYIDGNPDIYYRADDIKTNWMVEKWHPSIHMFRKDSRITLEITDIKVERVQDISGEDIDAEIGKGIFAWEDNGKNYPHYFAYLWDSINAKRGYSWSANPWVWVVSFKVIK